MSLSGSLTSALSGLSASSRAAELVSSNVANAMTEGYGRREVVLSSQVTTNKGQGVKVGGVMRYSDPVLLSDRRLAESRNGANSLVADFMKRLETALGTPDTSTSLTSRVAAFDTALREAASRPDSDARLAATLEAAGALAAHITSAGSAIQAARVSADKQISSQVDQLNTTLSQVADLNSSIRIGLANGRDTSAFVDQRQRAIDSISAIIPVHEIQREGGGVALYTTGGAVVLEATPAKFEFTSVGIIVPGMSQASGALSGLIMNGRSIASNAEGGPISGGTLAAQFAIRDVLGPEAQTNLDAVARDLVDRFSDPTLDATLTTGAAGLFTDTGHAFSAADEVGLSQRLKINAAVDPSRGGSLWRLRDGLGAVTAGQVGDASLINRFSAALDAAKPPLSGGFSSAARSFATLSADMTSYTAAGRVNAENEATYSAASLDTLKTLELEGGVDTDQEMQSLLLIEQAYAANAKVISVVNSLLQTVLDI